MLDSGISVACEIQRGIRKMRLNIILLAVITLSILLTACGGSNSNPYDGTWQAVYPTLNGTSTVTATQEIDCTETPGVLVIRDSAGSTTISATCTTTLIDSTTSPPTYTPLPSVTSDVYVSVNIATNPSGGNDILHAVVNGVTFTGQCISTRACGAANGTDTLGLTR